MSSSGPPSQGRDHSELPTLLHFSAAHGLERLTCALLDCPGARHALTVANVHGATPVEIARESGHQELGEILAAHQHNPSTLAHVYDFVQHGPATLARQREPVVRMHNYIYTSTSLTVIISYISS